MLGTYQHTIDAKGRVFVPAKLRGELGRHFYVTVGLEHCLLVYSEEGWQRLMDRYLDLHITQQGSLRYLFSNATECEPDKQNRILLPVKLRNYAGLGQEVVFLGLGDHAEIWNVSEYETSEAATLSPEYLTESLEKLGF